MHMQFVKITEIKEIYSDKGYKIERLIKNIGLVLIIMLEINMYNNSVEKFWGKNKKMKKEKG